jgi:hypothetical protein
MLDEGRDGISMNSGFAGAVKGNPFDDAVALTHSPYLRPAGGDHKDVIWYRPRREEEPVEAPPVARFVHAQLRARVESPGRVCVGAEARMAKGSYAMGVYKELASNDAT